MKIRMDNTWQDHYFLNGKTAGAKLPTYEDCIKADRELVMDITNQGAVFVVNMYSEYIIMKTRWCPNVQRNSTKREFALDNPLRSCFILFYPILSQ